MWRVSAGRGIEEARERIARATGYGWTGEANFILAPNMPEGPSLLEKKEFPPRRV